MAVTHPTPEEPEAAVEGINWDLLAVSIPEHQYRQLQTLLSAVEQAQKERDELQATFDLRWEADMRAIKRWQEANPGNDLTWPDRADMVVWLLEQAQGMRRAANSVLQAYDANTGCEPSASVLDRAIDTDLRSALSSLPPDPLPVEARDALIEKMAQTIFFSENADGWTYQNMASAALSAIEDAGFWIAPLSADENMTYAALKTLEPVFDDARAEPNEHDWQKAWEAMRKASPLYEEKGE